jgi:hypothetical protein
MNSLISNDESNFLTIESIINHVYFSNFRFQFGPNEVIFSFSPQSDSKDSKNPFSTSKSFSSPQKILNSQMKSLNISVASDLDNSPSLSLIENFRKKALNIPREQSDQNFKASWCLKYFGKAASKGSYEGMLHFILFQTKPSSNIQNSSLSSTIALRGQPLNTFVNSGIYTPLNFSPSQQKVLLSSDLLHLLKKVTKKNVSDALFCLSFFLDSSNQMDMLQYLAQIGNPYAIILFCRGIFHPQRNHQQNVNIVQTSSKTTFIQELSIIPSLYRQLINNADSHILNQIVPIWKIIPYQKFLQQSQQIQELSNQGGQNFISYTPFSQILSQQEIHFYLVNVILPEFEQIPFYQTKNEDIHNAMLVLQKDNKNIQSKQLALACLKIAADEGNTEAEYLYSILLYWITENRPFWNQKSPFPLKQQDYLIRSMNKGHLDSFVFYCRMLIGSDNLIQYFANLGIPNAKFWNSYNDSSKLFYTVVANLEETRNSYWAKLLSEFLGVIERRIQRRNQVQCFSEHTFSFPNILLTDNETKHLKDLIAQSTEIYDSFLCPAGYWIG